MEKQKTIKAKSNKTAGFDISTYCFGKDITWQKNGWAMSQRTVQTV